MPAGPKEIVPGTKTFILIHELSNIALDQSDLALLDLGANDHRKARCVTRCHSNVSECHRPDPL